MSLQLFLASPSDVLQERKFVREIVTDFNNTVADNLGIKITLVQWEDATPNLGHPQDLINERAENSDLVVVIFWRRVGTPTRDHQSGTLEEFEKARERWERSGHPRVWVYFREVDQAARDDPGPQLASLLAFRNRFTQGYGLSHSYSTPDEFRYLFHKHLYRDIIERVLPSEFDAKHDIVPLGVMPVVSKTAREDLGTLYQLRRYVAMRGQTPTFTVPLVINPPQGPVEAYAGGLAIVEKRFWTTAFLDSVYWGGGHPAVLAANQAMLARLCENQGSARRLFIGAKAPRDEAEWLAHHLRYLKDHGREVEANDRLRHFDFLRKAMTALARSGFETRVGTDETERYKRLPLRIDGAEFFPYKFGLTIYDNKRVDVFQEGKFGLAGNVNCFTPAMSHFDTLRDECERYFAELWEQAIPFDAFLEVLDAAAQKH